MNVRKPVDYSAMFAALDTLMAANLPQMELWLCFLQYSTLHPQSRGRFPDEHDPQFSAGAPASTSRTAQPL